MTLFGIPRCKSFYRTVKVSAPTLRCAKWKRENGEIAAINENLARELLELFTLTPSAGYSQEDVNNVAYILTGYGRIDDDDVDDKYFSIKRNEPGNHKVSG